MSQSNTDQAEFWTADAGQKWVAQQEMLDALMQPVLSGTLARAALSKGERVLDVGCGTGASTLQAVKIVGPSGSVCGVDISPTMLESARYRATGVSNVEFLLADAAEYQFGPDGYDQLISRFGVMFFSDPRAAFSNMAKGLKTDAQVTFSAWGQIQRNPWFTYTAQAAKAQLGAPPSIDPDAPGPFSFRDTDLVAGLLAEAGFDQVTAETVDMHLAPRGTPEDVAAMATNIGPAARTVAHFQGTEKDVRAIAERLQSAFEPFETPKGVRIPAEINFFQARRKAT